MDVILLRTNQSVPVVKAMVFPVVMYGCESPWDFPGKNRVGCHFLLQGIFPTQGSNLCLLCFLYWQADFFTISNTWEAHSSNGVNNTIILMRITKTMHAEMNG